MARGVGRVLASKDWLELRLQNVEAIHWLSCDGLSLADLLPGKERKSFFSLLDCVTFVSFYLVEAACIPWFMASSHRHHSDLFLVVTSPSWTLILLTACYCRLTCIMRAYNEEFDLHGSLGKTLLRKWFLNWDLENIQELGRQTGVGGALQAEGPEVQRDGRGECVQRTWIRLSWWSGGE